MRYTPANDWGLDPAAAADLRRLLDALDPDAGLVERDGAVWPPVLTTADMVEAAAVRWEYEPEALEVKLTTADRIRRLLSDGVPRTSQEIAAAIGMARRNTVTEAMSEGRVHTVIAGKRIGRTSRTPLYTLAPAETVSPAAITEYTAPQHCEAQRRL